MLAAMRLVLGTLLSLVLASAALAQPGCVAPPAGSDGWRTATPENAGFDPAVLCAIGPRFQAWQEANVHAVLVLRHSTLVYEHYFTGSDERWDLPSGAAPDRATRPRIVPVTFDRQTSHDLRSITKSVVALVVGIAIDRGQFPGLDEPILAHLPSYAAVRTPEKDRITVRHLLTMSQGLAWNEDLPFSSPDNNEAQMMMAEDPAQYVLSRPVEQPPGTAFTYSGGSATLLAALLRERTGQSLDTYARDVLFDPLGIADWGWVRLAGDQPAAASGLRMRPRDLVKIGQLVLDRGTWRGEQVVPAAWIEAALSPQIGGPMLWYYGFQFWLGRSLVKGQQVEWVAGVGLGGQRLFIVPSLDLVVLVHAGLYKSPMQAWVPLGVLNRFVLAAIEPLR